MNHRHPILSLLALVALGGVSTTLYAADADDRDRIYRTGNASYILGYVISETTDTVSYVTLRMPAGTIPIQPQHVRTSELDHIVYYGMQSGHWVKGQEDRESGNFDSAAEHFNQMVTLGTHEWEKVYGSIAQGECLELAGHFAEAAAAYDVVVKNYAGKPTSNPPIPPNRLWLDSLYHEGLCLAEAKSPDANKVADRLEELDRKENLLGSQSRASAIRAGIAASEGNLNAFLDNMKKVTFNPNGSDHEVWFTFNLYCAETLRLIFHQNKEAASVYRNLLSGLGEDVSKLPRVSLGLGLCLMDHDRSGALIELLKLDLMPYGSADQKCEARLNAARLLWAEAQAVRSAAGMKNPSKAQFVLQTESSARFLAGAASEGPAKNPNVALAHTLMDTFGPEPVAGVPEPAPAPKPPATQPGH